MEKEGIKRIIILSIIFLLSTACMTIGIIKYNNGYGKNGDIRKELNPIIKTFNKSENIKKSNIYPKASLLDNKILVSYIKDNTKYEIEYTYIKKDKSKILKINYNDSNKEEAEYISKEFIEIVSSNNNGTYGEIFKNHSYNYLYLTNLEKDGIELYKSNNLITLSFPINKNIYTILNEKINKEDLLKSITTINIKDIFDELDKNQKFILEKENTYLYVDSDSKYYNIYISNTDNDSNNIYESMMSVIKVLNVKLYDKIRSTAEKFNTDRKNINYIVEINPELNDELTALKRKFIKVSIKK